MIVAWSAAFEADVSAVPIGDMVEPAAMETAVARRRPDLLLARLGRREEIDAAGRAERRHPGRGQFLYLRNVGDEVGVAREGVFAEGAGQLDDQLVLAIGAPDPAVRGGAPFDPEPSGMVLELWGRDGLIYGLDQATCSRATAERADRLIERYMARIDPPDLMAGGATAREENQ